MEISMLSRRYVPTRAAQWSTLDHRMIFIVRVTEVYFLFREWCWEVRPRQRSFNMQLHLAEQRCTSLHHSQQVINLIAKHTCYILSQKFHFFDNTTFPF